MSSVDVEVPGELRVDCDRCGEELSCPGGLLLSPPAEGTNGVTQRDLCIDCYRNVIDLLFFRQTPENGLVN